MKSVLMSLIFAVIVIYAKPMAACEVFNSSNKTWDELPLGHLCEGSLEALRQKGYVSDSEIDYIDLVVEVVRVGEASLEIYIQAWDGDYLRFSVNAIEYQSDQNNWVFVKNQSY